MRVEQALTPALSRERERGLRIAGYAAVFGHPDSGGDVIRPGAFAASLESVRDVPLLWQHKAGGGNQLVGARLAAVAEAAGGTVIDIEARATIAAILDRLRQHGLIAS